MIEIIIGIFLELGLQLVGEVLAELGLQLFSKSDRRPPNPWLSALGYALLGAVVGAITLWIFPIHFVKSEFWRLVNLFFTPLAAGGCMMLLGAWRAKHGQQVLRIDKFAYGMLFAVCLAGVRYMFGRYE
jgi:hypothetical protein